MRAGELVAVLIVTVIIIMLILNSGCQFKDSTKMKCATETTVKRKCDSEGSGREFNVIIQKTKAVDE